MAGSNWGEPLFTEKHTTHIVARAYWVYQLVPVSVVLLVGIILGGSWSLRSVILGLVGLGVMWVVLRWLIFPRPREAVIAYQQGLVVYDEGQQVQFAWADIKNVWEDIYQQNLSTGGVFPTMGFYSTVLTLELHNGREIELEGKFMETTALLYRKLTTYHIPDMVQTIDGGGAVAFGDVTATRAGVSDGATSVPWAELSPTYGFESEAQAGGGFVRAVGMVQLADIPNVFLLQKLADHYANQGPS